MSETTGDASARRRRFFVVGATLFFALYSINDKIAENRFAGRAKNVVGSESENGETRRRFVRFLSKKRRNRDGGLRLD